jgi:catechol 1,2-dioxygenase
VGNRLQSLPPATMTSYDDRRFAGDYVRHDEPHPSDAAIRAPWYALDYTHVMEPGGAILPQPPIK